MNELQSNDTYCLAEDQQQLPTDVATWSAAMLPWIDQLQNQNN
jgi:hypothetical protein